MKRIFWKYFSLILAVVFYLPVFADEKVTFEVNSPMIVEVGETFRIEFTLNAKPDEDSFKAPSFEGFDVIAGPAVSQGTSIQIVNGSMSKSISHTISYVLIPQQKGEFKIGQASATVKGVQYSTRETIVEVREGAASSSSSGSSSRSRNQQSNDDTSGKIEKDDLQMRLVLSRSSVYKGEPIRATLKLYSRVNIAGSEGAKMPTFNGFWSQDMEVDNNSFRETLNGKVYEVYPVREYVLYPQQSGTLRIDPAEITIIAQVVVQTNRGFDPFFGGGHEIYNVRRQVVSPAVNVQVKEFPAGAPASFTGAVGRYSMKATLSSNSIQANSAANLNICISGNGNINFLKAPELSVPSSFELYDIKTTDAVKNTVTGGSGQKTFEYPFIARAEGEYTLGPVEFTYFNPESGKYVTLSSEEYTINVAPDKNSNNAVQGVVSGVRKEDIKLLGSDIRFIKLGKASLKVVSLPLFLSPTYNLLVVIFILAGILIYFLLNKRINDNKDIALVKGRRANKVAIQRFKSASKYMKEQDKKRFYEEMLKALWGYLGDKFNIPVSDLTKEVIRDELSKRGAAEAADRVIDIISSCEEAQYSPIQSVRMQDVYASGLEIVSKIESVVRRK